MYKKLLIIIVVMFISIGILNTNECYAATGINICVDGKTLNFGKSEQGPFLEGGTTFVPLRLLCEILGYSVEYDKQAKSATIINGTKKIKFTANSREIQVIENNVITNKEISDTAKMTNNGVFVLPLKVASENLGLDVEWDNSFRTIFIFDKEKNNKEVIKDHVLSSINPKKYDAIYGLYGIGDKENPYDASGGYIDKEGKIIIPKSELLKYSDFWSYAEGYITVYVNDHYDYMDRFGNFLLGENQYSKLRNFQNGYAIVETEEFITTGQSSFCKINQFIIDKSGKVIGTIGDNQAATDISADKIIEVTDLTSNNGNYPVYFIDVTGKRINDCKYQEAQDFVNGLAVVKYNEKYGAIDTNGNWVIRPTYDHLGSFNEGIAYFSKNGKSGVINTNEQVVFLFDKYKYTSQDSFKGGLSGITEKYESKKVKSLYIDSAGKKQYYLPNGAIWLNGDIGFKNDTAIIMIPRTDGQAAYSENIITKKGNLLLPIPEPGRLYEIARQGELFYIRYEYFDVKNKDKITLFLMKNDGTIVWKLSLE